MLLGGLWHGANWTFVVWGALHGLYLCMEKLIQDTWKKKNIALSVEGSENLTVAGWQKILPVGFLKAMFVFFLVNVTWVFFRASDFTSAWRLLVSMFSMVQNPTVLLSSLNILCISIIITGMVLCHWRMRNTSVLETIKKMPAWLLGMVWGTMIILLILSQESSGSFIYFQF